MIGDARMDDEDDGGIRYWQELGQLENYDEQKRERE